MTDVAEDLLEPENFIFQCLYVELFTLAVRPAGRGLAGVALVGHTPTPSHLCACRLSSCRLVKAGLLSGLGPRRFCGCPSEQGC
jgi:hypothetical protein